MTIRTQNLTERHILTTGDEHVIDPTGDEEIVLRIDISCVASEIPTVIQCSASASCRREQQPITVNLLVIGLLAKKLAKSRFVRQTRNHPGSAYAC
jgi:hypothetical protein